MHKKAEKMYYVSLHLILMKGGKNSMIDYRVSGGPYLIQFTYVSTVALQQEGSGFEPASWSFLVWSLHVLPIPAWVFSGYSCYGCGLKPVHFRSLYTLSELLVDWLGSFPLKPFFSSIILHLVLGCDNMKADIM